MDHIYSVKSSTKKKIDIYACDYCTKTYKERRRVNEHLKVAHKVVNSGGNVKCLEKDCAQMFVNVKRLESHLRAVHRMEFEIFEEDFSSMNDFETWLKGQQTHCSFVKKTGEKNGKTLYYQCSRSGFYKPTGRNKRRLKAKVLMAEAKLGIAARRDLQRRITSGEPLNRCPTPPPQKQPINLFGIKKNYYFRKRTARQIEDAGAYEIEPYRKQGSDDRAKEKEKLQNKMAYGEKAGSPEMKRQPVPLLTRQGRLEELAKEVQDRMTFLQDMHALGQAKRYDQDIKEQVACKLREMRLVEAMTDAEFAGPSSLSWK